MLCILVDIVAIIGRDECQIRVIKGQELSTILFLMEEEEDKWGDLATVVKDFLTKCWSRRTRRMDDENMVIY